jgi:hypothetical protein
MEIYFLVPFAAHVGISELSIIKALITYATLFFERSIEFSASQRHRVFLFWINKCLMYLPAISLRGLNIRQSRNCVFVCIHNLADSWASDMTFCESIEIGMNICSECFIQITM